MEIKRQSMKTIENLRADATAADTRGNMGPRYELHWSVLGARDLKKSLKKHRKSVNFVGNQ